MADELFLIDGNSLAYRAFFALPESIATSTGVPTNAIFGFASMLVKILTDYGPKATVVVWDRGHSGRKEVYSEYKAQRSSRPDLLKEQWPHLEPLVEAFGYRNIGVEGYEADDVIASIAERAKREEPPIEVMIVTGDRDAYQLVDDRVRIMTTSRGITDTRVYDRDGVVDRYGIPPELVPDFIGLKGDTSDNIPGVPGIGDKTAADLLQRFGSLENVLSSVDEISGAKRKQNLTEHAQDARISKQLATAQRDIDLDGLDIGDYISQAPDRSKLRDTFREFELRDPLRRLEEALGSAEEAAPAPVVEHALSARTRQADPSDLPGALADDAEVALAVRTPEPPEPNSEPATEPTPEPAEPTEPPEPPEPPEPADGVLFAPDDAALFAPDGGDGGSDPDPDPHADPDTDADPDSAPPPPRVTTAVYAAATDIVYTGSAATPEELVTAIATRPAIAHNAKALGLVPWNLVHDTEVGAYLLEPARRAYPFRELCEERGFATDLADPAAADARLTQALAEWQREELRGRGLTDLFTAVELPIVRILREMEQVGVRLDTERLQEISTRVKAEADGLEREIYTLAGTEFTLGSPRQLEEVLFGTLGLSRKRRGKTGYSTDARVLQAIRSEHEIVPKIERWRELTKLAQTYLDALPLLVDSASRLHTTFNQTATATGRLSSNNPNLQNIPIRTELGREIRACFVAAPGNRLVSADYSQVELRLLAHIASEDVLKEIFRRGEDVHTATACRVFNVAPDEIDPGMRSKSKMINYGIVYGLSAYGMADRLDIPQDEAAEFIERYMAGFPAVKTFIEQTIEQGTEHGYVSTLFGRRRQVPELRARRWELRKQGERFAVNMVIQGTAADIMKVAMVRADTALAQAGLTSKLVLQIHDELLFEGPEAEAEQVREIAMREMAAAYPLDPALAVEAGVGLDWLSAK